MGQGKIHSSCLKELKDRHFGKICDTLRDNMRWGKPKMNRKSCAPIQRHIVRLKTMLFLWEHFSGGYLYVKTFQYEIFWVRSSLACACKFILLKRKKKKVEVNAFLKSPLQLNSLNEKKEILNHVYFFKDNCIY